MSKKLKKFFAGLLAFVMVFAMTSAAAPVKEAKAAAAGTETVAVGAEVSYTGMTTPGYTFDSSSLTTGGLVGAMVFNITVNLPAEGDVYWNDWCGEALAVHANGATKYYDFGGAQVGWGIDVEGDNNAETTGVGTESWVGSVTAARTLTVTVPVNADTFTIDFFDNCWDSAADIPHYTIHSATAVYGYISEIETVSVNQEVGYTGSAASGYTFDSSCLTKDGTAAYAVFNINIALPAEGDVAWNDWCGEAAKVTVGDNVKYYDFGGAQVSWGSDLDGDENADTKGVGSDSWVGSAENRSISAVFPVNGKDFTVDFYDNCWDSATDIPHYVINTATVLYAGKVQVEAPETVAVGAEVSYTGMTTPGYTFDSSSLTRGKKVGAMVFNITINLPAEGDVAWNDWCGEALAVNANGKTKYYDFGGAQVGWGIDVEGDNNAETSGVGTESWVGSVTAARNLTVTVPVNAESFTIDFFDNCWDSAADIPHYTIHSATAVYGNISELENVTIGQDVSYTGLTNAGYIFDSSSLTKDGTTAYAVFNISIALPAEGDVTWNDWCGEAAKVTMGEEVKYFDFGGAQVGWGVDMNGDEAADTTGVGSESWAGSAENRSISAVFPIGAEDYFIEFFDNCWDSATDIPHYTINSATILYGVADGAMMEEKPTFDFGEEVGTPFAGEFMLFLGMQGDVASDNDWGYAWTNSSTDFGGVTGNTATAKVGDTVTISLTFPSPVFQTWWLAPCLVVDTAVQQDIAYINYTIDSLKIDGVDVTDTIAFDDVTQAWNYDSAGEWPVTKTLRLAGGYNTWSETGNAIVAPAGYTSVEYTITINALNEGASLLVEEKPTVDKNGTYHAYMGIQTNMWEFRNAWDDASYGLESLEYPEAHSQFSLVDSVEGLLKKEGTFTDVEIAGNGSYSVKFEGFNLLEGTTRLNLLFLSTDIPNTGEITFSNVKAYFGGKEVLSFADGMLDPDSKDWVKVLCINMWNNALEGSYPMADIVPTGTVEITFDVSGFDYNKAGSEPAADPTEAPAEPTTAPTTAPEPTQAPTETPAASGGMNPVVIVVIVVAVVAVAGVAVVLLKKKK